MKNPFVKTAVNWFSKPFGLVGTAPVMVPVTRVEGHVNANDSTLTGNLTFGR